MRILSFGTTGQLAIELARHRPGWAELTALGRDRADLTDPAACAAAVTAHRPALVINAAAYTAVDQAETDAATARTVNAESPGAMARAAAAIGAPILHVSTDYVFDGSSTRPWREDDPTGPLGVYGRTKLEGEGAIAAAGGDFVILRTAWVFSAHGRNFVKTMLRLGAERDTLSIVADQRGGPTPAADIAGALWTVADAFRAGRGRPGIFHYCGAPTVSWADFAEAVFAAAQLPRKPAIIRIATADYPTPATRPANSALDCARILAAYGIAQPDWRAGLRAVMTELETT
ncbi:MAG: dTDP-4-dehydrorhamnose reductase [Rhodobacteraceae bacterium]|nr:dTDP-4-dehydrorhamnose reductase [Paracoccaceae bacterium]